MAVKSRGRSLYRPDVGLCNDTLDGFPKPHRTHQNAATVSTIDCSCESCISRALDEMGYRVVLDVCELAGGTVLSGAPSGLHLYGKLVAALPAEPAGPERLLLDFSGVEVATASYLRESVVAFRHFVRNRKSNFYPVVTNASDAIIDDLLEVASARGDVILACQTDSQGDVVHWQTIGKLDPMRQLTFDLVIRDGETSAPRLAESEGGSVKITAWNNRLASLSNLGLIREYARGRAKFYKPLFEGGPNGG